MIQDRRDDVITERLSAGDAIHVAVMQPRGVSDILSFDRGFDGIPGIARRHG
jgi:predicted nucleic acid-binding protein